MSSDRLCKKIVYLLIFEIVANSECAIGVDAAFSRRVAQLSHSSCAQRGKEKPCVHVSGSRSLHHVHSNCACYYAVKVLCIPMTPFARTVFNTKCDSQRTIKEEFPVLVDNWSSWVFCHALTTSVHLTSALSLKPFRIRLRETFSVLFVPLDSLCLSSVMDGRDREYSLKRSPSPSYHHKGKRPRHSLSPPVLPPHGYGGRSARSPFVDDRIGKPIHQGGSHFASPGPPRKGIPHSPRHVAPYSDHQPPHPVKSNDHMSKTYQKFEFSLRIGNLNYQYNERETYQALFEEFRKFGYIEVKVLGQNRDRHAYVNFTREEDARRAKRELQDKFVFGRNMRIEWSRSTLSKINVSQKPHGQPPPPSHHHQSHQHSHDDYLPSPRSPPPPPLRESREPMRHGSGLRHSSPPPPMMGSAPLKKAFTEPDPSATRTLFVGNLATNVSERELREVFGRYGRIESVDIKCPTTGTTAYAFVKFMTITDAITAKEEMQDRYWGSHRLRVGYGKGTAATKVWVGNLSGIEDMIEVEKKCDQFGIVKRVDYRERDDHGYVYFMDYEAALIAVQTLQNLQLKSGHWLKMEISRSSTILEGSPVFQEQRRRHSFDQQQDRFSQREEPAFHSSRQRRKALYERLSRSPDRDLRAHLNSARDAEARYEAQVRSSSPTPNRYHPGGEMVERRPRSDPKRNSFSGSFNSVNGRRDFHARDHHRSNTGDGGGGGGGGGVHKRRQVSGDWSDSAWKGNSHVSHRGKSAAELLSGPNGGRRRDMDGRKKAIVNGPARNGNKDNGARNEAQTENENPSKRSFTDITEPSSPESDNLMKDFKQDAPPMLTAESLSDFAKNFPVTWRGNLLLKNTAFPCRMLLIGGDPTIAELLVKAKDDAVPVLKITQRLRLEQPRLDEVNKRIASAGPKGHCLLLALPGNIPSNSSSPEGSTDAPQYCPLRSLVSYLTQKEAAGIVSLSEHESVDGGSSDQVSDSGNMTGVLYAFPPCNFAHDLLLKVAPNLGPEPSKEDHIVAVVMRGAV